MTARKYNRIRSTVKNLRRELRATREVINYQRREIADLRKRLSDLNSAKGSEIDRAIDHLQRVAIALRDDSIIQRERITARIYGTTRI